MNIGGLAIGIAVALLIGLWINDELSFNKYHKNYDRIAQVMVSINFNEQHYAGNVVPRPLEFELRKKYGSSFSNIVMSRWTEGHILSVADKKLLQSGRFMQEAAPEMLSLRMINGNYSGLKDIHSILLSSSSAIALFGKDDPMNKTLRIDNETDVKVTGVYEDIPYNSDFNGIDFISTWDLMIANNKWMQDAYDNWGNSSYQMYVQLKPGITHEAVSAIIKNAKQDNVDADAKKFNQQVFLQPMSKWHLYSEWKNGINTGGRIQYVWLFGIIGFFVLLLACINFMNLSTARSEKRAKEVGIRKSIGSVRIQLVKQFLSESILVAFLSFLLAILLVVIVLPWFNELADKKMTIAWSNPFFWLISFFFVLITGIVAGSYPALYLSSFNAVKVLKGTFRAGRFAAMPRKILVVLQYTVSIALIIGTIIVYQQIQYAKSRPVGYTRDGLLMIPVRSAEMKDKFAILSTELKSKGIAIATSGSSSPVTAIWSSNGGFSWKGKDPKKEDEFSTVWITHDYGKTVGWQIKEGRDYSTTITADSISQFSDPHLSYNIIVNEAAVKYMGLAHPVGEVIRWNETPFTIVGVVKDMVMESPFNLIKQAIYLVNYDDASSYINIRLNPQKSMRDALAETEIIFKKLIPSVPFEYKFADTEYALKFAAEERIGKLAAVFSTLAVLISCLGLFGLASFIADKRTKEIGIRKVLGATVYGLWQMLSKEFIVLVMIACLITIPFAYYFLNNWLQNYEYRTEISWWVFAIAFGGALLITILTVSLQAIKAAIANPVKSLRTE